MPARTRKATAAPAKPDFMALLDDAHLAERVIPVCTRADLAAEHEALDAKLTTLLERPNPKLGDDGRADLRRRLLELEDQMTAATYPFRLRAMPQRRFKAFRDGHPPRKDEKGDIDPRDKVLFVNTETIWEPLVRACLVDPQLDDPAWERLIESLTNRQFEEQAWTAWKLNRGEIDVPFSLAASQLTTSSGPG